MENIENHMVIEQSKPKAEIDDRSYQQKLEDWVQAYYPNDNSELMLMFQEVTNQQEFYSMIKNGTFMELFKQWFRSDIAYNWTYSSEATDELGESKVAEMIHELVEEQI
jgi:hypothetical protein